MLYSENQWWWSWIWKRPLDEEKETIRRTGTSQGGSLVLQEYGWWKRQSWTIRLYEVTFLLMSHMLLIVLIVLILQRFELTCGIVQRRDGLWGTGSALVSRMISLKKLRKSNRQDFVFIRPPGISHGAFQLRMDNVWFCKILLLFQVESETDVGQKRHSCAFVSVLEEYSGHRRPGE